MKDHVDRNGPELEHSRYPEDDMIGNLLLLSM